MSIGEEKDIEKQVDNVEEAYKVAETLLNPILYTRGIESDCFYLILSGKVMICAGNEGFMIS